MILKHGKEVQCKYITEGVERELRQQGCLRYKPEIPSSWDLIHGRNDKARHCGHGAVTTETSRWSKFREKVTSEGTAVSETSGGHLVEEGAEGGH